MTRRAETPDCVIRRCTRAAGKSGLCARHFRYVPFDLSMALAVETGRQSHELAKRHYRRWAKHVQAEVDAGRPPRRGVFQGSPKWEDNTRAGAANARAARQSKPRHGATPPT